MKRKLSKITPAALLALLILSSTVFSDNKQVDSSIEPAEPLKLRKIMQEMGRNMQVIVDGISREDWKLVADTAPLIADHPKPPLTERTRIIAFIGTDAKNFKSFDKHTHDTARELTESAARGDSAAVLADFSSLQKTCLTCHQAFRETVQEHFYGPGWGE